MSFTYLDIVRLKKNDIIILCPACHEPLKNDVFFTHKIMVKCLNSDCPMIDFTMRKKELLENYSELYELVKKE